MILLKQDIIDWLKEQAQRETWTDDIHFNPMENSGGNFDDAYHGGCEDGRTYLARDLIAKLHIK